MGFPSLYVLSALIEADALICGGQPRDALVVLSNLDEKIETDANRLIWVFLWLIARSALGKSTSKMDEFTALLNHVGTVTWDTRGIQEWKQSRIHDAKAQAFVEDLIGRLNAKQPRVMKCYELMGVWQDGMCHAWRVGRQTVLGD